jgi:outer membrane protein OmpA-like peptidoglycan-associated protein
MRAIVKFAAVGLLVVWLGPWLWNRLSPHKQIPITQTFNQLRLSLDQFAYTVRQHLDDTGLLTQSASPSQTANVDIASANLGGNVEWISGSDGPGYTGHLLLEAAGQQTWAPDGLTKFPIEIVVSFYHREAALISAVIITEPKNASSRPKNVEVWTSSIGPDDGFRRVAATSFDASDLVQTLSFVPTNARYVQVRILSATGPDALKIERIKILEASPSGYVPLLTRDPDIAYWKNSPRHAAQRGIEWLQAATMDFQRQNRCFGCHVQAQSLMGLSIADANGYIVNQRVLREVSEFIKAQQNKDGWEEGPGAIRVRTQFAAMATASFDHLTGEKSDENLISFCKWLLQNQELSGRVEADYNEPPILQGSFMTTANAAVAFRQAFAEGGDTTFSNAADKAIGFLAQATPQTTQDKVFTITALSHSGNNDQMVIAQSIAKKLEMEQHADGGWGETAATGRSDAFATGQVLYALKEAGTSIDKPTFVQGVKYLLQTQKPTGAWPPAQNAGRPTEFAPTMWAVIGLAGSFGASSAVSDRELIATLDSHGSITLNINFDFDLATLRPEAVSTIDRVASLLNNNPALFMEIDGHTDDFGTPSHNRVLSEQRALAVQKALESRGIDRHRLSTVGLGSGQPVADNATEDGRFQNRRVELIKKSP